METTNYRAIQFRVRYSETDQMGVVYHANYLHWCELGRTEYIRSAGISYRELEAVGVLLPVTQAELTYQQPARYDDMIEVRTSIAELSPVRITFCYEIWQLEEEKLLAWGRTSHVFVNQQFKPVRLSRHHAQLYQWLSAECKNDVQE